MNPETPGAPLERYLLEWLGPALFALLVSATIRFHSLVPMPSMPRVVGNLLALASIGLLALTALGRQLTVPRDIGIPLLALMAAAAVAVLGSGDVDVSLLRLEIYVATVLLAVAFYLTYRDARRIPVAGFLLGIGLVHLPFLAAAIAWIHDLTPPYWREGARVAHFVHVRQFGEFGFLAAVSSTAVGMLSRRLALPSFLLATAALFGLVATGCRAALLSWVLFLLLLCCFSRNRMRAALHGLLALAISGGMVWYLDASGVLPSPNIFGRVMELIPEDSTATFDSGRISLWIDSMKQILLNPLFGSGPEGYWLSGCCDRTILQAHNFVLQFLIEFGLVGCALAALILWRTVRRWGGFARLGRYIAVTSASCVLACMIAAFLAYSLIDQMMYHLLPLLHLSLFTGLLAANLVQTRRAESADHPRQSGA